MLNLQGAFVGNGMLPLTWGLLLTGISEARVAEEAAKISKDVKVTEEAAKVDDEVKVTKVEEDVKKTPEPEKPVSYLTNHEMEDQL